MSLAIKTRNLVKNIGRKAGVEIRDLRHSGEATFFGLQKQKLDTIFDVGANYGQFARFAARFFPEAVITAFEPIPECHEEAKRVTAELGDAHKVLPYALGPEDGEATFNYLPGQSASSSFLKPSEEALRRYPKMTEQKTITVPVRQLDGLVTSGEISLGQRTLLKLDVQGFEYQVLQGATDLLAKVDFCLLEYTFFDHYDGQASFVDLVTLLAGSGLVFAGVYEQKHDTDGRAQWCDVLFEARR